MELVIRVHKNRASKGGPICVRRKLNRTIRDHRDLFKLVVTSRISLSDSINSMVELINAQLNSEGAMIHHFRIASRWRSPGLIGSKSGVLDNTWTQ
uniref:Uncharacterized protein n=1 Tax=Gossypium raimondii TaxID=29730 RepID=A0A0D2VP50_GOSRA|nr:hypothetical protein B456_011G192700 [Gossypium raimondii]